MDANGQRFALYADPAHFSALDDCVWQPEARVLTLARERAAPPEADRISRSDDRWRRLPAVRDSFGQLAQWDNAERMLRSQHGGLVPETASPVPPLDLALDAEQVLLMALPEQVRLVDLRGRFEPINLGGLVLPSGAAFSPVKLACDGQGGRWALDRRNASLARITGTPWRRRAFVDLQPDTFRPHPENPHEPALQSGPALPAGIDPVLLACSPQGQLAVVSWGARGACSLHRLTPTGWAAPRELPGAAFAHALRWLDESHVALWAGALDEALVYALDDNPVSNAPLDLLGRRYPLRQALPDAPPVQSQDWPPHYLLAAGGSRPLVPLSWRAQSRLGRAQLQRREAAAFDTCWHRLNIEAELPEGCAVLLELAARDDEQTPTEADYHPHWLGDALLRPATLPPDTPRAARLRAGSELPLHPGLLPDHGATAANAPRGGCYTVLIQRAGHSERSLRGRWLHGRITLMGNGQRAPCVAALRVWGERYSYASHYLPALYSDDEGADRSQRGPATPVDFTERFTQLFESELTRWEDLAANAHLLTGPHSTPPAALPWLAALLGQSLPPAFTVPQARAWLATAPQRVRQRGTLEGLRMALDVALDGAVSRGAVIVLEDFRLRRTLATLLGVDLSDQADPLLPGLRPSANSIVGDGLILGEGSDARDFLTAFLPEALDDLVGEGEAKVFTQEFYARTAHRATVLLHEALSPAQLRLAQGIVAMESPAHVAVRLLPARAPFLVGIASLVGVDTFLRDTPKPAWARVSHSVIGRGDVIAGGSLFDAVGSVPSAAAPLAVIEAPAAVSRGQSFELRADRSSAADGRSLLVFRWTQQPPAG
jgi:phage tail-like protein